MKRGNIRTVLKKSNFDFVFAGHGHYRVTYTSPVTDKSKTKTTNDMELIDKTKNTDSPKKKDLLILKRLCKS